MLKSRAFHQSKAPSWEIQLYKSSDYEIVCAQPCAHQSKALSPEFKDCESRGAPSVQAPTLGKAPSSEFKLRKSCDAEKSGALHQPKAPPSAFEGCTSSG